MDMLEGVAEKPLPKPLTPRRSVFMDRLEGAADNHTRLVEHSPQLPQGFTPIGDLAFWPGAAPRIVEGDEVMPSDQC